MEGSRESSLTAALEAATSGDRQAAEDLLPLVYAELRSLAKSRMAQLGPGQTLQPTALVHEAFARLVEHGDPLWKGRGHFFAAAARSMRNILVDRARAKASLKRGGGSNHRAISDADIPIEAPDVDILALNELLEHLEAEDPQKCAIVHMRFFVGLTQEETAALLDLSVSTVKREWRYLRRWLYAQLEGAERTALEGD